MKLECLFGRIRKSLVATWFWHAFLGLDPQLLIVFACLDIEIVLFQPCFVVDTCTFMVFHVGKIGVYAIKTPMTEIEIC